MRRRFWSCGKEEIRPDCGDGRDAEHEHEQRRHKRAPADTCNADH